jgi:hypothetical protein
VSISLFCGSLEADQQRASEDFGRLVAVKVTHLDYSTSTGACAECYFWWKWYWRTFCSDFPIMGKSGPVAAPKNKD